MQRMQGVLSRFCTQGSQHPGVGSSGAPLRWSRQCTREEGHPGARPPDPSSREHGWREDGRGAASPRVIFTQRLP